jgi:acyl-CoA synthetase (AMP-forming)/AMP-acid ligase II
MVATPTPAVTSTPSLTVPFARNLATHGNRIALIASDEEISYAGLAGRVDALARQLGDQPRLVLLAGANTVDAIVAYLAALAGGHPLLLVPGDRSYASTVAAYDPDVVIDGRIEQRRPGTAHPVHPELALLLTTSGSTGSAKLVRLSHENLQANAESIAGYLGIRDTDRAATTLPMHYCYGLSVINSHLLRGAALILTGRSVADDGFWELFRTHRGTSFAGVPYTFDLLDRVGFDHMRLPHLRYVTQAGGRLAPERVRRYAELGRRHGWDLFVMYGQTEATARMAYLPPDRATTDPHCIGVPVPGGSFRLAPLPDWPEPDTGELVYAGPNVMLGYAEAPPDLAAGRTVTELYTGDIARRTPDGLYEIVGRRSRFVKVYGLRIDLQWVEATLERHGITACCVGDDRELLVAAARSRAGRSRLRPAAGGRDADPAPAQREAADLRRLVAGACGLPPTAVRVALVPALPRLPSGKPDYEAVRALAPPPIAEQPADLKRLFADVLGREDVTDDSTFVGLGGDSLSYVEMSVRLERALGALPEQWHTTTIRALRRTTGHRRRRATIDTSVALRAIATVLIVGTHATLFGISGGAHLLMGVAGYNFARFQLTAAPRTQRVRGIGRSVARIAFASMTWIGLVVLLTDDYSLANVLLLNYVFGDGGEHDWHFWFIESLVYIELVAIGLAALPWLDRLERRWPFGAPMAVLAVALVTRYELVPGVVLPSAAKVPWLFAIGWAAAKATTTRQRWLVTAAIAVTVPGYFGLDQLARELLIVAGLVLLVWVPRLPSLRSLNRLAAVLAASSLYIYLTHWQVYPWLYRASPALAVAASLLVGIGYAMLVTRATARLLRPVRRLPGRVWLDGAGMVRHRTRRAMWRRRTLMVGWSGARTRARSGDRGGASRRHPLP